jgi:hypothetical protein
MVERCHFSVFERGVGDGDLGYQKMECYRGRAYRLGFVAEGVIRLEGRMFCMTP